VMTPLVARRRKPEEVVTLTAQRALSLDLDRLRFDEAMAKRGRATVISHEQAPLVRSAATGLRQVDALGTRVSVGCAVVVREGNATIEVRSGRERRSSFDLRALGKTDLEDAGLAPFLCRLRTTLRRGTGTYTGGTHTTDVAFATSVSDGSYLWKYWRWMLNKLCVSTNVLGAPYYLFVGAPVRGLMRRSERCPATREENLAHTTKAMTLFLAVKLRLARRVIFLDADIWYSLPQVVLSQQQPGWWIHWLKAAEDAKVALPAPCYKQFFGASVVAVDQSDWTLGFLQEWYDLRCGPKDQPSLWHLVFRSAGREDAAKDVLDKYHDTRCLNATTGELTKNDCTCDNNCGYYASWKAANDAFLDLWNNEEPSRTRGGVVETSEIFQVNEALFTPGGSVAYLPNARTSDLNLLCGPKAPLRHVKWLRKSERDLPADLCGRVPDDLPFKGPRDADFSS